MHSMGTGETGIYLGSGFSIIQNQTPLEMPSVAAAINLFIVNIIGLGIGPFPVGFFSDMFESASGIDSLRSALLSTLTAVMLGS
jgi:hypothetical protein